MAPGIMGVCSKWPLNTRFYYKGKAGRLTFQKQNMLIDKKSELLILHKKLQICPSIMILKKTNERQGRLN